YVFILNQFMAGSDEERTLDAIINAAEFSYLQPAEKEHSKSSRDFSTDAKSAVFLRDALKDPLRCGICGGLIHRNAISVDHVQRKADGGHGSLDNGQLTHPYCN